ncbi:serine hydrolase domain-containing protein [Kribbella monticola]|uniref:hypothetical protein n=1 Tax=Kribbella monticola TaxID=2185285 RepID=UPI0018E587DF|nr:hypothetical protein [Kribbella monticola]
MSSWQAVDRLDEAMAGYVDRGEVAGLITLVSRPGEVRVNVLGTLAYGGAPLERDSLFRVASPLQQTEAALGVRTFGPPKPRTSLDPDEWIRRLATLPLQYQPGERWRLLFAARMPGGASGWPFCPTATAGRAAWARSGTPCRSRRRSPCR